MKKLFFFVFVIGGLTSAPAQGTFQFAVDLPPLHPDLGSPSGFGVFTLDGSTFRYRVDVSPFGPMWVGQIQGPGPDGPVLFDLPRTGCEFPLGTNLGSCWFRGAVQVPESWTPDLMANRWYLTAMYPDVSADVHLQGQIVLVPEPSTLTFIGIAGGLLVLRALRLWRQTRLALPA